MQSLGLEIKSHRPSTDVSINSMDEALQIILDTSRQESMNAFQKISKLVEELGELSEALLSYSDTVGCGYKGKTKEDILEEACDTSIRALSMLACCEGVTEEEILAVMSAKISKWRSKVL